MYTTLVAADVLDAGAGFSCSSSRNLRLSVPGWGGCRYPHPGNRGGRQRLLAGLNLLSNPDQSVDLARVDQWSRQHGRDHWVDSLQTWVARVGGVDQFGHAGIVAPGEAFWTIADLPIGPLTTKAWWTARGAHPAPFQVMLILELSGGLLVEQCAIVLEGERSVQPQRGCAVCFVFPRPEQPGHLFSGSGLRERDGEPDDVGKRVIPVWIKRASVLLTLRRGHCPQPVPRSGGRGDGVDGRHEPGFCEFSPTSGPTTTGLT